MTKIKYPCDDLKEKPECKDCGHYLYRVKSYETGKTYCIGKGNNAMVKMINGSEFSDGFGELCKDYPTNEKFEQFGHIIDQHESSGVTLFHWTAKEHKENKLNVISRILIPMPSDYCILIEFVDMESAKECFHSLRQEKDAGAYACGIIPGEWLCRKLQDKK